MKHTKGNWNPVNYAGYWMIQKDPSYKPNSDILDADNVGEKTAEANAKLIAAAQKLLESLQNLVNAASGDTFENLRIAMSDAKQAIKKATK